MKKEIISLLVVLLATVGVKAQQIAVVSEGGTTSIYQTLPDAIEDASAGSVIYLPGGGFQIADDVKITKKLTIIGIGHKANEENADGSTIISGNLFLDGGSGGSSVMGCYISGNVNIGNDGSSVNNVLIKYCNLNSVQVRNKTCLGTVVNQNYIRASSNFNYSSAKISNNIIGIIQNLDSGEIINNICCIETGTSYSYNNGGILYTVNNTRIIGNIFRGIRNQFHSGSNCQINGNLVFGTTWGNDPIIIDGNAQDVFVDVNGWSNSPYSNFHFKEAYKQYENQVGIYAGTGFNDHQMAPVPYIVAKRVDEQTDASGMLNIKIRIKAGE